jgi:hypothetical protein
MAQPAVPVQVHASGNQEQHFRRNYELLKAALRTLGIAKASLSQ